MHKSPKSKKMRVSAEAGFSLIEAVLAVVIFAIGILGAYSLQINATQGNTLANRVTTSANWAAYSIEELLARNYDDILLRDDDISGPGVGAAGLDLTADDDDNPLADGVIYVQPNGDIIYDEDDDAPGSPLYTIYYNVAEGAESGTNENEDYVLRGVKLIRTHVFREEGIGKGHLYTHNYYKTVWPESDYE